MREETRCCHMAYSFWLAARVLLYAPSHRQDNIYHSLCYTSREALAGVHRYINTLNHDIINAMICLFDHPTMFNNHKTKRVECIIKYNISFLPPILPFIWCFTSDSKPCFVVSVGHQARCGGDAWCNSTRSSTVGTAQGMGVSYR